MALKKLFYFSHLFMSLITNTIQEDFRLEDERNGKKLSIELNNDGSLYRKYQFSFIIC